MSALAANGAIFEVTVTARTLVVLMLDRKIAMPTQHLIAIGRIFGGDEEVPVLFGMTKYITRRHQWNLPVRISR